MIIIYLFSIQNLTGMIYQLLFSVCLKRSVLTTALFLSTEFCIASVHDLELWTWEKLRINLSHVGISGENHLYFENVNRFNDDISNMFMDHQMLGVQFHLPWWEGWSVMPALRYIDERSEAIEYRYMMDIYFEKKRIFDTHWGMICRFRIESKDIQDQDDITWRYRQSVSFSYPLPLLIQERPVKTYFTNEVNLDFRINKLNRHRFETGFKFPFTQNMTWTLGYQIETNSIGNGSWVADNMIMTGFDFRF